MSAGITAITRMLPEVPGAHENAEGDPRAFTGFDVGPFFVHAGLSDNGAARVSNTDGECDTWHVSHRATGLAVQKVIPTHARAIWLARKLAEIDVWDGSDRDLLLKFIPADTLKRIHVLRADAVSGDCQGEIA